MACGCKGGNGKVSATEIKDYTPVKASRLSIFCVCGLQRLIPTGLSEGDTFELTICPKCGNGFRGRFEGEMVRKLD